MMEEDLGKMKNINTELILRTEYDLNFDELRKSRMCTSYYKYGPMVDNYKMHKTIDALKSLQIRIDKYLETGNTEYLVDAANFAMIEYMYPSVPGAKFLGTDDTCGVHGMGVNQIKDFSNK